VESKYFTLVSSEIDKTDDNKIKCSMLRNIT